MKKLRLTRKKHTAPEAAERITNETVAEHRKRILAGGRRFKYPIQYAKHRLVINTIIISLVALIAITVLIWWQLYPSQNTSTFFYRITRVLPLPVASVDGHAVRYSDYLVLFRAQEHYKLTKEGVDLYSKENKSQLDWLKRETLNDAEADSYAAKLAKELNIKVTNEQIEVALKHQRTSRDGVTSQETYDAIILDHYNWTPSESRDITARKLLRQEVAYKIDTVASRLKNAVIEKLKSESNFEKVAASIAPVNNVHIEAGAMTLVPGNNQDGGRAEKASKLNVGQVSEIFRSTTGDGYYVVKLLQKDNNRRVSYSYLKIALTAFQRKFEKIKSDNRIKEYINVPVLKSSILPE